MKDVITVFNTGLKQPTEVLLPVSPLIMLIKRLDKAESAIEEMFCRAKADKKGPTIDNNAI